MRSSWIIAKALPLYSIDGAESSVAWRRCGCRSCILAHKFLKKASAVMIGEACPVQVKHFNKLLNVFSWKYIPAARRPVFASSLEPDRLVGGVAEREVG